MRRRDAVKLLAVGASVAMVRPARAAVSVPDLGIFCDPTLRPAVTRICALWKAQTGVPAAVLCAPGPVMLAQLVRHARNDILITRSDTMDEAVAQGLTKPETRRDLWQGALVLAVKAGTPAGEPAALAAAGPLAATDPTPAATFDGHAVLGRLGLATGKVIGAANTGDVADLVLSGAAHAGLVYATDVAADPALAVGSVVPGGAVRFSAVQSSVVLSWRAADFLSFLASPAAIAAAKAGALESVA